MAGLLNNDEKYSLGCRFLAIQATPLVVIPFYYGVCNKDLRGFKNLAGLVTLLIITKLTVY
jgi:hydrogenase-4 membrane subunit HyfE